MVAEIELLELGLRLVYYATGTLLHLYEMKKKKGEKDEEKKKTVIVVKVEGDNNKVNVKSE